MYPVFINLGSSFLLTALKLQNSQPKGVLREDCIQGPKSPQLKLLMKEYYTKKPPKQQ